MNATQRNARLTGFLYLNIFDHGYAFPPLIALSFFSSACSRIESFGYQPYCENHFLHA
jgi:cytochrome c biogenesis protein CcdA